MRVGGFHQAAGRVAAALAALALALAAGGCGGSSADGGGGGGPEDTFARCQDGADNDGDGAVDCADPDCGVFVVCEPAATDAGATDGAGGGADDGGSGGGPAEDAAGGRDAVPPDGAAAAEDAAAPGDDGDGPAPACDPCGNGSLRGLVCAPSEQVFVSQAHVTIEAVDCAGQPVLLEAWSQPDGTYYFPEVPCGTHTVVVEKGSFRVEYPVPVRAGEETDISGPDYKLCFGAGGVRIAAFWGQWDELHLMLERLGFEYDWYEFRDELYAEPSPWDEVEAVQLLRDPALLAAYDIVFLSCGSAYMEWAEKYPDMARNLRDWVAAGGSLYATDLAWVLVERAWPDAIDFFGAEDADPGDAQVVLGNHDHLVTVVDADLVAYLGGVSERDVHYGAGPLISVAATGAGTTTHATAFIDQRDRYDLPFWDPDFGSCSCVAITEDQPVIVSFVPTPGGGRVIYTTFHNDEQADQDTYDRILHYLTFLL